MDGAEREYQRRLMGLHGAPEELIEAVDQLTDAISRFGDSVGVDRSLDDGEAFEAGSRSLRAHLRPGHSPTDLILVDEGARTAIVGDHFLADDWPGPALHRPLDGPADPLRREGELQVYLESLERTSELELDVLHPGHGELLRKPQRLIEQRVHHELSWCARLEVELASGEPKSAYVIACGLYGETALRQPYETLSKALGLLDLLIVQGRVTAHEGAGGLVYQTAA